jgi:2-succinyl-5-enolpyruvyl-6-hydroxy-3-cyclohexene-1-carboxylate synthase
VNPSTAFATVFADELVRCGLRDTVIAPGSRSAPLAIALFDLAASGLRLHVRIDERSAAFLALGLAKAGRRPVAVLCTSGTAAASFHPAAIEADESGVPLLLLTADRPPELRGTSANQTIDQVKLYGGVVRWFCDVGVPEARAQMTGYWRSVACRAWAHASGAAGGYPGPVHLNMPLREPLVPGLPDDGRGPDQGWPEPLEGREGGAPWTSFAVADSGRPVSPRRDGPAPAWTLDLPWTQRGVVVCGDGDYDTEPLLRLAERAGWPVLAEPSSGARRGPNALRGYVGLLGSPAFAAAHRPDLIVSAGRPGLSRPQLALLRGGQGAGPPARHVVIAQGPGSWADPARTATDVAGQVRLSGRVRYGEWLENWQRADAAASRAADDLLDGLTAPSEPRLARDLAAALPDGALLWVASSLPIRDLDQHMAPRGGLRILASRGASGIDGLVSSAIGAALAHASGGGGPAFALLGDLAFLHDAPGLVLGPAEPRPDLCLIVVNNDGGGIFSTLEPAAVDGAFERLFGTPHGAGLEHYARAAGIPHLLVDRVDLLVPALLGSDGRPPSGLRIVEVRTERTAQAALRAGLARACAAAADSFHDQTKSLRRYSPAKSS